MKKKELKTFREKDIKTLRKEVEKMKKEFVLAWAEIRGGKEKNVNKARNIKKDIAQLMTIIREKELMEEERKVNDIKDDKNKKGGKK